MTMSRDTRLLIQIVTIIGDKGCGKKRHLFQDSSDEEIHFHTWCNQDHKYCCYQRTWKCTHSSLRIRSAEQVSDRS